MIPELQQLKKNQTHVDVEKESHLLSKMHSSVQTKVFQIVSKAAPKKRRQNIDL